MIYLIAGSWLFKALNCFLQWRNGIALLKLFYASRYQCNVTSNIHSNTLLKYVFFM